jgi:GNAT superfamily N-acetyltransferase
VTVLLEPEWYPQLERPPVTIEVVETGWGPWFEWSRYHHYLHDAKPMPFSTAFTGFDATTGDPMVFLGMSGFYAGKRRVARACRMVTHPEVQGAGIGLRFLNHLAEREFRGEGFIGSPVPTLIHTAHPALCAALKRHRDWTQVSQKLVGGEAHKVNNALGMKLGGHWRSVAGFRYKR